MTRCRAILAVEAVALLAVLVWALARPVTASRGRDEIDYRHQVPFPIWAGQTATQPVTLQQDEFSGIAIPYQLRGGRAATIHVTITDPDGTTLLQTTDQLAPSEPLTFLALRVDSSPAPPAGTAISVAIQRIDHGTGPLSLAVFPASAADRQPMQEQFDAALALETLYGAWSPAVLKSPIYADRVSSLAPPWFPLPVVLLLAALLLIFGLTLPLLIGIGRSEIRSPAPLLHASPEGRGEQADPSPEAIGEQAAATDQ